MTDARICAVVKANAYGHGLKQISAFVQPFVDELAVATIDEAQILARNGVIKPINILGNLDKSCDSLFCFENVYPTIACLDDVKYLVAKNFNGSVNIKINSGMNRIGIKQDDVKDIVNFVIASKIKIKSFFSHFYNSNNINLVNSQFKIFNSIKKEYCSVVKQFHICASNCLNLPKSYHLDMVRTGLAIYGYGNNNLQPALCVKTNILQIFNVAKGEHIGYGTYVSLKNSVIAAIRVGYGDGYRRIKNGKRFVSICGVLCPLVGQICMDICMVDISETQANIYTPVYLVNDIATVANLAKSFETIDYEVLTSFGARAKRIYVK